MSLNRLKKYVYSRYWHYATTDTLLDYIFHLDH